MKSWSGHKTGDRIKLKLMNDGFSITVRDAAERLALTADEVNNIEVIQADFGACYRLLAGGDPSDENDWIQTTPPGSIGGIDATLLDDVTTNGGSSTVGTAGMKAFSLYITSRNVVLGATVDIQCLKPDNDWTTIHTQEITTNDEWVIAWQGSFKALKAVVSGYQDGNYDVSLHAEGK
jgi:hypothetical protein